MKKQVGKATGLTALLISPDRALAEQFTNSLVDPEAFQVVADLKSYPSRHTLLIRLRQVRPDVLLLDLNSDREIASDLMRYMAESEPSVQVVGLSLHRDSELLLASLRLGASEFLHAPFDSETRREAVSRLMRLRQPDPVSAVQPGIITVFASVKPGSGASTLALQSAISLRRRTGKRVLLADLDLLGGATGFQTKLTSARSFLDAMQNAGELTASTWSSLISDFDGVDVLGAPVLPFTGRLDLEPLCEILEFARLNYDYVLIDLPVVFDAWSLTVLSNSDQAFLVSTADLPSLHLARKAVRLLDQLGVPRHRFQVLLNRLNGQERISRANIEKLLGCPICSEIPNDYFSLNRVFTLGQPLDAACEFGKAVDGLASRMAGAPLKAAVAESARRELVSAGK